MRQRVAAAVLALACARPMPPVSQAERPPEVELPRDVRPLRYDLELTVNPERERFEGTVEIEIELDHPTAVFFVSARELTVDEAFVEVDGARLPATLVEEREGVARLTTPRELPAGRATLHVDFTGAVGDRPRGLFRVLSGGSAYAYTQAQPDLARRLFPCFDDPFFRAPFDVTLVVPEGDLAVSNAPVVAEEPAEGGMKRVRFARTPPLPTELFFAAVGPFAVEAPAPLSADALRGRVLPLRGLSPRGLEPGLEFALEATRALVPLLERETGVPFPYEKLDLVVAPGFDGGMENPGALLFGEGLLVAEGAAPREEEARAALLLARELAHQWFGDLSRSASFRDAWLSESFAEFEGEKAVAAFRPEDRPLVRAVAEVDLVMDEDALGSAVAVERTPARSEELALPSGRAAYAKGAAVLAGLERFLGAERFRGAVEVYLREYPHRNGGAEELAAVLSRAAGRDLSPALKSALDQPGVPLLVARSVCDREGPHLDLRVERERPLGARPRPDPLYTLPVCARYEAAGALGEACGLVENGHGALPLPACPRWFMPAAGGLAYYRWAQRPEDLAHLRDNGFLHLSDPERLSYALSLRAGVRAGRLPFAEALSWLAPLTRDGDPRIATSPMPLLSEAIEELLPREARAQARARAAELYRPRLRELTLAPAPGEAAATGWLRQKVVEFMVEVARDPEVTRALAPRGLAYAGLGDGRFHPGAVAPELAPAALAAAVREGDPARFDELAQRLVATREERPRAALLAALASAADPVLSARSLALAGDARLAPGERADLVLGQAREPETREAAFKVFQKQFSLLAPSMLLAGDPALPDLAYRLCDRERVEPLRRFLERQAERLPALARYLPEVLERVENCAALREAEGASALAYFTGGEEPADLQREAQGGVAPP